MQKAVVVRAALGDDAGQSWSIEVDPSGPELAHPLRRLLAEGWRVAHTCAMPCELDSCCLVILEKPDEPATGMVNDAPLSAWNQHSDWLGLQTSTVSKSAKPWDGTAIKLEIFGLDPTRPSRN